MKSRQLVKKRKEVAKNTESKSQRQTGLNCSSTVLAASCRDILYAGNVYAPGFKV